MARSSPLKSTAMKLRSPRRFGDPQLEQVYQRQQLHQNRPLLQHILCVLTAGLLLLAVNHLPNPDLVLILATVSAAFALGLQAYLLFKAEIKHQKKAVVISATWMCLTVICMLPAGGQSALLPIVLTYFTFYTMFPFELLTVILLGSILALLQIISFIFLTSTGFTVDQLLATILVHIWCNFIGIYLYTTRNRLCRAAFLNARNALASQHESMEENVKMGYLLSSALPQHVISTVQNQIGVEVPKLYVEHYGQTTIVYAKFYRLESILSQISVQDSARLLNEFEYRIDQLIKRNGLIRVQSDSILVISGAPQIRDTHALVACQFAWDLVNIVKSFCDSTTADLSVKVGIASGSISCGIVGCRKWHYDVIGPAYDTAIKLEELANANQIFVSEDTKRLIDPDFDVERVLHHIWRLKPSITLASTMSNNLLFPNQRRFSLVTVPQAINRVLQTVVTGNESKIFKGNVPGRRKKKQLSDSMVEKLEEDDQEDEGVLKSVSLRFQDDEIEKAFHIQMDRWFIPALAISIFFLVVYGLYQVLVMPRLVTSLALIVVALAVMFVILLMLYVNYFESFCQFITRTSAGHSIAILLILVLLYTCGIVNTFSCPSFTRSPVCRVVHYSMISVALWMITTTVFVRFSSMYLLVTLITSIVVFSIQIFWTHADLYVNYSIIVGWRIEFDLLIGLVVFALLIYLQARRNVRMIRLDYLSILKAIEERSQIERYEYLNEQILLNALPSHIAYNYMLRTDPYCHLCHSVGVISARIGKSTDWNGELGFNRINDLIYEIDGLIDSYPGLEKVRSSNCVYVAAVGVLPEISKDIHDTPFTIGDLLASLTKFGLNIRQIAIENGLDVTIGIDCGSALSVVIGNDRPRYNVIGNPVLRATKLMNAAGEHRMMVSEEIYLALRPRNFRFNDRNPITVSPGLVGYVFINESESLTLARQRYQNPMYSELSANESFCDDDGDITSEDIQLHDETTQSTTLPLDQTHSSAALLPDFKHSRRLGRAHGVPRVYGANHNPLEMFASMNSSFSSELYSIDVSVETDSEMEWITPEMLMYDRLGGGPSTSYAPIGQQPGPSDINGNLKDRKQQASQSYKGDRAKQYSDFSETENMSAKASSRFRRKRYRPSLSRSGPKIPNWLSSRTSFTSEVSLPPSQQGSMSALDRLNAAARRVDRMLKELASVDVDAYNSNLQECPPFPTNVPPSLMMSTKSVDVKSTREMSSACHTEYDNADDSDGVCSDSEMITSSRLEDLKRALKGSNAPSNSSESKKQRRWRQADAFVNGRQGLKNDGNDADIDSNCSSLASSTMFDKLRWRSVHSVGYENEYEFASETEDPTYEAILQGAVGVDKKFVPADADADSDEEDQKHQQEEILDARGQMVALSRDIQKEFGKYTLDSFSDIDAEAD